MGAFGRMGSCSDPVLEKIRGDGWPRLPNESLTLLYSTLLYSTLFYVPLRYTTSTILRTSTIYYLCVSAGESGWPRLPNDFESGLQNTCIYIYIYIQVYNYTYDTCVCLSLSLPLHV